MRRRPAEHRRPPRRRLPWWIWCLLLAFVVAAALLFALQDAARQQDLTPDVDVVKNSSVIGEVHWQHVNFTDELLSSTSFARQLADQMALAKAYVVIAKEQGNLQFAWELSSLIRSCQRLLSESALRGRMITEDEAHQIISRLARLIYKAQDMHYDISTTIVTLKNHVVALEERAKAAIVQSAAFGRLATNAVPKDLHCLSLKLTEQWFADPGIGRSIDAQRNSPRLVDNNLYHFCLFSDNILATSVVINSTVSSAEHPQQLVFHIVTDEVHYRAMATWFLTNDLKGCTIEVRNINEFSWLNASYSPLIRKLTDEAKIRQSGSMSDADREANFHDSKYVSLLNHLRFYIPQIHPQLEKVVYLDDDIVVQKDLIPLFSVELHGNVIGSVETCLESSHRFHRYINFSHPAIRTKFDPQACGWAFGMNIVDLIAWKKANVTALYHYWQEQNSDSLIWRTGTLPVGFLTFYGLVEPLDRRWHVLGLGYDPNIDRRLIESAAVVHYDGHMKPWLKLAIGRYRHLWGRHVNFSHPHIGECKVN